MTGPARVLVTGASGFIGSTLVPYLVGLGCHVNTLGRIESADGASGLVARIVDAEPAVVIHLATQFVAGHDVDDIPDLVRANVEYGTLVAEGAAQAQAALVSLGSAWQHFEGHDYDPVSLYAATKQALSVILDYYSTVRGLSVREVVLFDTYGPGDLRPKLVPSLLRAARTGRPLEMSDGDQLIDLTFVDDIARGIASVALAEEAAGPSVLRSWEPVSVRGLVATMETAIDRPVPVTWGVRPARPREMRADWVFGRSPAGWTAGVTLGDGLRRTWDAMAPSGGSP
jgi:nucleoside-diphosphate-sugar epimerase